MVSMSAAMKQAKNTKKLIRHGQFQQVEKAVELWYCRQRKAGIPVTLPMIVEAGNAFYRRLHPNEPDKQFSEGWAQRVAQRHNLRDTKTCGESRSADTVAAVNFRTDFKMRYVDGEEYDERLIFNVDETGLYFRMLPDRTLASKIEETKVKG